MGTTVDVRPWRPRGAHRAGKPVRTAYAQMVTAMVPAAARFDVATRDPEAAQTRRWQALAGRLGLGRVDHLRQLQEVAPLSSYADLEPAVRSVAEGREGALRGQVVRWLEPTGGTSGAQRLLPITDGYLEELQAGLAPWLADLFTAYPGVVDGPAYWSISPMGRGPITTSGGVPIGAVSDAVYFPPALASLLAQVLAVPSGVASVDDLDTCRYATALHLLATPELAFISVWSPTFLTLLLRFIDEHGDRLLDDLGHGVCSPPGLHGASLRTQALAPTARPRRAVALRCARDLDGRFRFPEVWPHLAVVSLWMDASSAAFVREVVERLPGVALQPKGLLATEGIVTFPLADAPAPVVAVESHLYEFIPTSRPEAVPHFAHELDAGETYEVVLTTGAGLLRHRLGDVVRVEGFYQATPCLRFLGRAGATSDLVGEKLTEDDVRRALTRASRDLGIDVGFALLAPTTEVRAAPCYQLFVEGPRSDGARRALAHQVDQELRAAHAYDHARALHQLGPIEPVAVHDGMSAYERRCLERGQRAGDIKPCLLRRETDWASAFLLATDESETSDTEDAR